MVSKDIVSGIIIKTYTSNGKLSFYVSFSILLKVFITSKGQKQILRARVTLTVGLHTDFLSTQTQQVFMIIPLSVFKTLSNI